METIVLHSFSNDNFMIYLVRRGGVLLDRVVVKICVRGSEVFKKEVLIHPGFLGFNLVGLAQVPVDPSVLKGEGADLSILVLKNEREVCPPVPFLVPLSS
ncbi:MAG: hypothetical protein ABIJ82_01695 [Patescibacteria group bacterium]|nr:hypothetical protein [Patescibacteria group bacterium]MBU1952708.1 hypothetical protein [Patescibacteria group bacterium]